MPRAVLSYTHIKRTAKKLKQKKPEKIERWLSTKTITPTSIANSEKTLESFFYE